MNISPVSKAAPSFQANKVVAPNSFQASVKFQGDIKDDAKSAGKSAKRAWDALPTSGKFVAGAVGSAALIVLTPFSLLGWGGLLLGGCIAGAVATKKK